MKHFFIIILATFISTCAFSQTGSKNSLVLETLNKTGKCSIFAEALKKTGFDIKLKTGTYTLFVPSDDAFKALPDSLLNDTTFITGLVKNSIVSGAYNKSHLTQSITGLASKTIQLKVLSGNLLALHLNKDHNLELSEPQTPVAMVTAFDLPFSAGTIHLINQVLIPLNKL